MLGLKSKSQFLTVKFSFFIMQTYSKNPMKKRRKETHPHHNTQRLLPVISIFQLRLVFQSFDVHLSLIYKKRPKHKTNETKQGEFLETYQNIENRRQIFLKQSDMSLVTLWLSFVSGVNRRASCMLSHYLTKPVYLFVNTFTLHGLFSAEFHNTNTTVNVKGSVVRGSEQVLDTTHLMKGYVRDSSNSLDSNCEIAAFISFQWN